MEFRDFRPERQCFAEANAWSLGDGHRRDASEEKIEVPARNQVRAALVPDLSVRFETGDDMSSFKYPDVQELQNSAAGAKKAMLEKFRAAAASPAVADQLAKRTAMHEARLIRVADREAARKQREAEIATEAARAVEVAEQAQREAAEGEARLAADQEERNAVLAAEQKDARDARYAARKAAKKERRRGY